jgi:predicted naringenin-chalcone synthase
LLLLVKDMLEVADRKDPRKLALEAVFADISGLVVVSADPEVEGFELRKDQRFDSESYMYEWALPGAIHSQLGWTQNSDLKW